MTSALSSVVRTRLVLVGAALIVVGLTGCADAPSQAPSKPEAAPPAQPAPALPPRPYELRLDGIDPCALLSDAQLTELGVSAGEPGSSGQSDAQGCIWSNPLDTGKPHKSWIARPETGQGAEYALGSVTGSQIVQIDGFPAVETTSPMADPSWSCIVLVDVAQGQSFLVHFQNGGGTDPLMTHKRACEQARYGASLMLQNLRSRSR